MTVAEIETMKALTDLNGKVPQVELRDLFAMNALQMFFQGTMFLHREYDKLAASCYQIADAMLKARER